MTLHRVKVCVRPDSLSKGGGEDFGQRIPQQKFEIKNIPLLTPPVVDFSYGQNG